MGKKKNKKFDLTNLVHQDLVKEGETLFFVSDPKKTCKVTKQPSGEFKVLVGEKLETVHAFVIECLGQEPQDHASKWLRNAAGKSLFDLWHSNDVIDDAA